MTPETRRWIDELLDDAGNSPRLTAWEQDFCSGLARRLTWRGEGFELSEKQMEVLKRIEGKIYAIG